MDWTEILTHVGTAIAILSILITWMSGRFNKIDKHVHAAHKRIDATNSRIDAMGARIDAMGCRIDQTQSIIMRMLEKKGM